VERCGAPDSKGREVTKLLRPGPDDYYVLKPKHSGFHSTSLDALLSYLGSRTLIIAGFATDICVVYTANDAYMREYQLIVPTDCVAAESATLNRAALDHIKDRLKGRVAMSKSIQ
jgi:nicotinamidase-related amidase